MREWRSQAACRGTGPALFYPEAYEQALVVAARRVCATCPVAGDCLVEALVNQEAFGVWGGISPRERRGMRRGMLRRPVA